MASATDATSTSLKPSEIGWVDVWPGSHTATVTNNAKASTARYLMSCTIVGQDWFRSAKRSASTTNSPPQDSIAATVLEAAVAKARPGGRLRTRTSATLRR